MASREVEAVEIPCSLNNVNFSGVRLYTVNVLPQTLWWREVANALPISPRPTSVVRVASIIETFTPTD